MPDPVLTPTEIDLTRLFQGKIIASSAVDPETIFILSPATIDEVKAGEHVFGYSAKRSAVIKNVKVPDVQG